MASAPGCAALCPWLRLCPWPLSASIDRAFRERLVSSGNSLHFCVSPPVLLTCRLEEREPGLGKARLTEVDTVNGRGTVSSDGGEARKDKSSTKRRLNSRHGQYPAENDGRSVV